MSSPPIEQPEAIQALHFFTQALAGSVVAGARAGLTTTCQQAMVPIFHTQALIAYINSVYGSLVRGSPDAYVHEMFFTHIASHSPVCILNILGHVGKQLYEDLNWPLVALVAAYDRDKTRAGREMDEHVIDLRDAVRVLVRAYVVGLISELLSHACTGCPAKDMPTQITNEVLFTATVTTSERADGAGSPSREAQ